MNDFYLPRTRRALDEAALVRLSRWITVGWGVVQIGVALGAEFMDRSVLDAGLSVLSLASGAVLGAFILATSLPDVGEAEAWAGMIVGLSTMLAVWGLTPVAFTWYVLIGASTTVATAWALSRVRPARV